MELKDKAPAAELLDADGVAAILQCSTRTVWRLADRGAMPRPVALGRLKRWNRAAIQAWIERGCPAMRDWKEKGR